MSSRAPLPVVIRLCVLMFLQYGVWSLWYVTMGVYLGGLLKFTGPEIGLAYSSTGWGAIIAPFLVGMIADRFFAAQRVMGCLHLMCAVLLWQLTQITDPARFNLVLILAMICYMPTLALANSVALDHVKDASKEFPLVRTFSPVGWIVAGLVVGSLPSIQPGWFGGRTEIASTSMPFAIAAVVSIVLGIYCFTLPHTPPKSVGRRITFADVAGLKTLQLLRDRSFAVFVGCSLLLCIPLSFYFQSGAPFLTAQGMKEVASRMSLAQVSDVVFLALMPWFLRRVGIKGTILVGVAAWIVRFFAFAWGAGRGLDWPFYLGILVHGMCYDFFFLAGQIYVDQRAPREVRANAQGFIALVTLGIGMTLGNLLNGRVTTVVTRNGTVDWFTLWMIPAGLVLVIGLAFVFLFREKASSTAGRFKT